MAKVLNTVQGETLHVVQLTQRELDVIVSILGQFSIRCETDKIFDDLKESRRGAVKIATVSGAPVPTLLIAE